MKKLLLLALALAAVSGFAEEKKSRGMLIDGVAAYVNAEFITIADVMNEVRRSPWAQKGNLREKRLRELYAATLNALIDRKLILDYARKSKMELQPWAVDNRIREIVANNFGGDETKLHGILSDRKISYEEWRRTIQEDLTVQAMRYQMVEKKITPTPKEIREEYDANKNRYQTEHAVAVSMIILDPPADATNQTVKARADAIFASLKEGKSFADLAKVYSSDSKAADGGSWGKINPDDVFRPEIASALQKLAPGEISQLIELDGYGYIVKKDEQQDSRTLTYTEAIPYVEGRLRMKLGERLYKEWTDRLRADAYVKIVELPGAGK
ncbi:MAG: peptidyl-prolyl cis-trans isomerase [Kiritimatiellae bacterium]|nr:peptidyl-prolyl cis-trans isomerase [Kiritimatiellia bacterium]